LLNYFAENHKEDFAELAELNAAIARTKAEEAKRITISHTDMVRKSLERIAKHYKKEPSKANLSR
jgi:hypothetical protein